MEFLVKLNDLIIRRSHKTVSKLYDSKYTGSLMLKLEKSSKFTCPICLQYMHCFYGSSKYLEFKCFKDQLSVCYDSFWDKEYFEFVGKKLSSKEFERVLKMKAFW